MNEISSLLLRAAWAGFFLGVLSGAVIGMFFHRDEWMGGYGSYRRRLTRLGHISFFGLGFINALFALTHHVMPLAPQAANIAGPCFLIAAASMPTVCFLTAWRKPWRHLFFIPVGSAAIGIVCVLWGVSG
ncbi:MAG: hypothetical protein KA004_09780 [Verrucomicrobiales bacterium]|nr:hypothetical protein [Verrucomicrobiales bacterium]